MESLWGTVYYIGLISVIECEKAVQGYARSLITVQIESAYTTSIIATLVLSCPVLELDLLHFYAKSYSFFIKSHPPLFHLKFGDVPLGLDRRRWGSKVWRLWANYLITFEVNPTYMITNHQWHGRTGGQTDNIQMTIAVKELLVGAFARSPAYSWAPARTQQKTSVGKTRRRSIYSADRRQPTTSQPDSSQSDSTQL